MVRNFFLRPTHVLTLGRRKSFIWTSGKAESRRASIPAVSLRWPLVCLLAPILVAQQPEEPPEDTGFVITTETNLVLTPFYVVKGKKYIEGLTAEDLSVSEDGRPQRVALFEGPGVGGPEAERQVPVEIILLLDVSLSVMNRSLLDVYTLKEELLDDLGDNVSVGIYAFANKLTRLTRPTRDLDKLQSALERAYDLAGGGTRLYEAVMQTCRDAAQGDRQASRFLLVLSDGFPTGQAPPEYAVRVAQMYGIPVYPVILGHQQIVERAQTTGGGRNINPGRRGRSTVGGPTDQQVRQRERMARGREQEEKMGVFAAVGEATGGQAFDPLRISNKALRGVFKGIAEQVRAEYVVGYYPDSVDEEKTPHQVQITLSESVRGKIYGGSRVVVH